MAGPGLPQPPDISGAATVEIETLDALRGLYAMPTERAVRKQLSHLDRHCRQLIALSPFVVLSSCSAARAMDASPRGGEPGFVKVLDERTVLIPDAPGNNRLDTLENILATRRIGLLFLVPGVDETLRVNGTAALSCDASHIEACANERRRPKLVIKVVVGEAYLHCAKAFMRSALWNPARHVVRTVLPSMGQMINDQTGSDMPAETEERMRERYARDL